MHNPDIHRELMMSKAVMAKMVVPCLIWQALKAEENPWQEFKKNKYTAVHASSERSKARKSDSITKEVHYHANSIYTILSHPSQ